MTPGPRQTVDRVRHPQRGEGIAVHENGPSFFQPDGGESIAMPVGLGGASSQPPRSWITLRDPVHGHVEADLLARGERHVRYWSQYVGLCWLVDEVGPGWPHRLEPDAGIASRFRVVGMQVGTPGSIERTRTFRGAKKAPETPEEQMWVTFTLADGSALALRRDGPPPAPAAAVVPYDPAAPLPGQLALALPSAPPRRARRATVTP